MDNEIDWKSWENGSSVEESKITWREREAQSRKIGSALFPFCKNFDFSNVREMHRLLSSIVELEEVVNIIELSKSEFKKLSKQTINTFDDLFDNAVSSLSESNVDINAELIGKIAVQIHSNQLRKNELLNVIYTEVGGLTKNDISTTKKNLIDITNILSGTIKILEQIEGECE